LTNVDGFLMHFKALTWNVNESSNSGGRIDAQLELIRQLAPDLVMLQAVRWEKWLPVWLAGLEELGFEYVLHTRGWAETLKQSRVWPHDGFKHHKVVITASRYSMRKVGIEETSGAYREAGLVFPERLQVSVVELPVEPALPLEVWNAGIVAGVGMGEQKVRMLEYVYENLAQPSENPRLLAGDFNSPKDEKDGVKIPFGADKPEYIRQRWQRAETNVLQGLERWGFQDAFTSCNGIDLKDPSTGSYRAGCYSHHIPPGSPDPVRRRLDHMIVSSHLESVEARYYTEVLEPKRENGYRWNMLSDHAPLVVEMEA
jgi:exodeoxyribonuclease III